MSSQTQVQSTNAQSTVGNAISIQDNVEVSPEQKRYANILWFCSWTGICVMVITFLLYMGGLFNPLVEPSKMPLYWGMNVHEYAQVTHAPSGWAWLTLLNHSDYLNLVGLAFLGMVSILGYLSLLIDYLRKKDIPYVTMVSLEILVIVLAASGILHISE